jgi:hypothetical protein
MWVSLAQGAVAQVSAALAQRIRPGLDRFGAVGYDLSEADYADCDVNDPFALAAVAAVAAALQPFEVLLSEGVRSVLVGQLADAAARRMEELVFTKRFTAVRATLGCGGVGV